MQLGKILRFSVRTLAFVTNTLGCWICLELVAFFGKRRRAEVVYCWVSRWSRINLRIYGVHVHQSGVHQSGEESNNNRLYPASGPNGIGRIFIMNHSSGMDIPIILTLVEAHVISRHDLADWPFLGKLAQRVGTLFVDRNSKRSGASALKAVAEALAAGEGVAMFPEGTAHPGDKVHEFRTGAFNASRRAEAEMVPLGLAYGNEEAYYRKESFLAHLKRVAGLARLDVAIEIGQPFTVADQTSVELKETVRQEVQQLVDRARVRLDEQATT